MTICMRTFHPTVNTISKFSLRADLQTRLKFYIDTLIPLVHGHVTKINQSYASIGLYKQELFV